MKLYALMLALALPCVAAAQSSDKLDQLFPGTAPPTSIHASTKFLGVEGPWYGQITDYARGEFRRNLTVQTGSAAPTCTWQEIGKKAEQPRCTVEGGTIRFTTRPGSTVVLHLQKNGTLVGTFAPPNGGSFQITMGREPIVIGVNTSIVGTWKGDIHCEKQSVSKMQWNVKGQTESGLLEGDAAIPAWGIFWRFSGTRVEGHELKMNNYEHMVISGNRISGKYRSHSVTDLCDVIMIKQ